MRVEKQRIFIKDLPETVTQLELEQGFADYGKVCSVEIKKRKEINVSNQSPHFAYLNIEIDPNSLQRCKYA